MRSSVDSHFLICISYCMIFLGNPSEFHALKCEEIELCGVSWQLVLGIGLKNQNRLIGNSEQSIIDYNRFSACFVRKAEYSFLPNIITVVFR